MKNKCWKLCSARKQDWNTVWMSHSKEHWCLHHSQMRKLIYCFMMTEYRAMQYYVTILIVLKNANFEGNRGSYKTRKLPVKFSRSKSFIDNMYKCLLFPRQIILWQIHFDMLKYLIMKSLDVYYAKSIHKEHVFCIISVSLGSRNGQHLKFNSRTYLKLQRSRFWFHGR